MRNHRRLALGAMLLSLITLTGACSSGGGSNPTASPSAGPTTPVATSAAPTQAAKPTIKIGSVGFDEARVMAEVYAQALEANGYTVDRVGIGLGTRDVVAPAIESGQIDLQPEYIGSRLAYELKQNPNAAPQGPTGDPAANEQNLQQALNSKGLTVLNYTPAQDTNAFVVRPDTASQLNLTKMSDTTAVQDQLKWGLATDCPTNPLCGAPGGALQSAYGITPQTIAGATLLDACSTPMADALKAGTIDLGELCSTQPDIIVNGWVILTDDKQTQPADNIAPIVRNALLDQVPDKAGFEKILNDVSAKIDTATLAQLYKQVAVDHQDASQVAKTWLQQNGFISQ